MNRIVAKCLAIAALMIAASAAAVALKPTKKLAEIERSIDLERTIPKSFGEWVVDERRPVAVVNPQGKTLIDQLYSQTLSRTYVSSRSGERIMLSIAYGSDQSDSRAVHLPDVCYPAQGFQILSGQESTLKTDRGNIPVKRLTTMLGNRSEPLTYWTTVGNKVALGSLETKLAQLAYGFRGVIPDGLIFRVSSISSEPQAAFALQDAFVSQLVNAIPVDSLTRLTGMRKPA